MKTINKPQAKLKISSCANSTYPVQEKLISSSIGLDFKFYQKLFILLLTLSTFLIFPESPEESDVLCKKYNTQEACIIW